MTTYFTTRPALQMTADELDLVLRPVEGDAGASDDAPPTARRPEISDAWASVMNHYPETRGPSGG